MVILALQKGLNLGPSGHEFHNFNKRPYEHYNNEFSFFPACVGLKKLLKFAYLAPPTAPWGW